MRHFSEVCNIALAPELFQNFVSAQYIKNKLTEFHQIVLVEMLYVPVIFANL